MMVIGDVDGHREVVAINKVVPTIQSVDGSYMKGVGLASDIMSPTRVV